MQALSATVLSLVRGAARRAARRPVLAGGGVLSALAVLVWLWGAAGQTLSTPELPGVPAGIARYRSWTKMNTIPLTDPSNRNAGPKNTYVNLSADMLRALYGRGGRVPQHFPDGAIIVRETLNGQTGFIQTLFVMTYDHRAVTTKAWVFSGYTRSAADKPFAAIPIADPVARCLNCHAQVHAADYVFTPYANRTDMPPAPTPAQPAHIEAFNTQFGPAALRVKAGTAVTWSNFDLVPHDVKAADKSFESGNIAPFGTFTATLTKPGTVEYFCAVHLGMRGTIDVEP